MELIRINTIISSRAFNWTSASILIIIHWMMAWICFEIYYACNINIRGGWITLCFSLYELIVILLIILSGITASVLQIKSILSTKAGIGISASAAIVSFFWHFRYSTDINLKASLPG